MYTSFDSTILGSLAYTNQSILLFVSEYQVSKGKIEILW